MNTQVISPSHPIWLEVLQRCFYDIYQLPQYVELEAQRIHALAEAILITQDENFLLLPYLLRQIDHDSSFHFQNAFDITSPYGYPGIVLSEAAATPEFINAAFKDLITVLRDRRIYSAFIRLHPILNEHLAKLSPDLFTISSETVTVDLTLSETEIWSQTRSDHRSRINQAKRNGYKAKMVPVEDSIDEFIGIYEETMDRVGSSKSYYFDRDYFLGLINGLGEKLHLCVVELKDQITCAGLFTECCGIVQYHLSGTRNEFLQPAPSKLMLDYARYWAKERGNRFLHLGGGVGGSNDSLFHFKAGFSKQRHQFLTLRLVPDQTQYLELVNQRAKAGNLSPEALLQSSFFPAYRSSG